MLWPFGLGGWKDARLWIQYPNFLFLYFISLRWGAIEVVEEIRETERGRESCTILRREKARAEAKEEENEKDSRVILFTEACSLMTDGHIGAEDTMEIDEHLVDLKGRK